MKTRLGSSINKPLKISTIQAVEKPKSFNDWIETIWAYNRKSYEKKDK